MPGTQPTAAGVAQLLAYSNTLEGAIRQRARTADLWAAVKAGEAEGGSTISGSTIFDMNHVSGVLRGVLSAEANLGASDPGQFVTGDMWAWAPWAADTSADWNAPNYVLRFEYQAQTVDGVQTAWGQTDWQGSVDDTTAQAITDRALGSASAAIATGSPGAAGQLGQLSDAQVLGVSKLQLLRV